MDLSLIDIVMPALSGPKLVARLADLGVRYPPEREEEFIGELNAMYARYYGATLREIDPLQVIREAFALILLDVVMPEMDGIELAQKCAQISPETKVMFITGFAAVTLKASREAPQAKILSKPFHLRDLVLEVQRMFGQSAQAMI